MPVHILEESSNRYRINVSLIDFDYDNILLEI